FLGADLTRRLEPSGVTGAVFTGLLLRGSISAGDRRLSGVTIMPTEIADVLFDDPSFETRFAEPWRPWHVLPGFPRRLLMVRKNTGRPADTPEGVELPP